MHNPQAWIYLSSVRIGLMGRGETETASRVGGDLFAVGKSSFVIVHLEDLKGVFVSQTRALIATREAFIGFQLRTTPLPTSWEKYCSWGGQM